MKKSLLSLAALCMGILVANAQNWCGTMENVQHKIAANPQLQADYDNFLNFLKESNEKQQRALNPNDIYIPVVFHIIHNGDAVGTGENITDAQILSQIDALNQIYQGLDPDAANVPPAFQSLIGVVNFHFCLARFDPSGNPTTGILREQFSQATWNTDSLIDNVLKPATIWDHTKYLNIWSVRMGGQLVTDGVLAYATFPGFGPGNQDGVVSRYNCIGTTGSLLTGYTKGKTVAHEVGHIFGLLHPWGSQGGCTNGWGGSDFVSDTPLQDQANFGCPTFPHVSCPASAPNGDMFMNYMDYPDDGCRGMFSLGQVSNVMNTLNQSRPGLKNGATQCFTNLDAALVKIVLPVDTVCSLSFNPTVIIKNEGLTDITSGKFYYQMDGDPIQIYNWTGNLPALSQIQVQLPTITTFAFDHTLTVTFGNPNGAAADDNTLNNDGTVNFYAYDGGPASVAVPFTEDFEGSFPQNNWYITNPNNDATWELSFFGAYGLSSTSVYINNFAYLTNPNKKKDALVTDAYDLSSIAHPELKFDVAYARRDAGKQDSLNVYYSFDCGHNWTKIWNQWGAELATAADATTLFVPQATEWKTVAVPLDNAAGQRKVTFKFENVTGWGNALYLDNINLADNAALGINEAQQVNIQVFPNPSTGVVSIRLPKEQPFNTISVYNNIGEQILSQPLSSNNAYVDLGGFATGLYFIHFSGVNGQQTARVLIAR